MYCVSWSCFRKVFCFFFKKRQFTEFKGSYKKNNYRLIVCNLCNNVEYILLEEEDKNHFISKYLWPNIILKWIYQNVQLRMFKEYTKSNTRMLGNLNNWAILNF